MISLTRLSGSVFVLNSDLVERVDSTPDTVITLVDGSKYVVAETLRAVVAAVRLHRAEVIALSAYVHIEPAQLHPGTGFDAPGYDEPAAREPRTGRLAAVSVEGDDASDDDEPEPAETPAAHLATVLQHPRAGREQAIGEGTV